MDLIIGGAYQGKRKYAVENFGISEKDIYICSEDEPLELSAKCIEHLEKWCFYCVKNGIEPNEELSEMEELISGKVIICSDISCGVVPIEADIRAWRECVGRTLNYLAGRADTVTRMFCSIPQRLK